MKFRVSNLFQISRFDIRYLFLFLFFLTGCTSEYNLATKKQERLIYGDEKEVNLGQAVSLKIDKRYDLNTDVDVNERVNKILKNIVSVCDRQDILYFIKIIDEDNMNAISLPGGYVYMFQGLMDRVQSDDELAGVIAHEVGHITAKHGIKRLQSAYGAIFVQVAAAQAGGGVAAGVNLALNTMFTEFSQDDEHEADRLAVKYMTKAGYDPNAMITFFEKMQEHSQRKIHKHSYWRTHPNISGRMAVVNQEITGETSFRDYIRLIEGEKYK